MLNRKKNLQYMIIGVLGMCGIFTWGCGNDGEKPEVVWYIENPGYYGVEGEAEPYKELKSERFELFNERLKELGIQADVVFKYKPPMDIAEDERITNEEYYKKMLDFDRNQIETLLQEDTEADIVMYQPLEYQKFLPLNDYLEKEENRKVKETIPEAIWNVNRVGEKIYQIPKGNVTIDETVYTFYKPFLEQYGIKIDTERVKQMTPKEVILYFMPYFEQERLLDDQYYLTSAADLRYENMFRSEWISVIPGGQDWNIALRLSDQQIINCLETMQEGLEVQQWIYENDLDAHIELYDKNIQPKAVFQITNIPTVEELKGEYESDWLEVPLGNRNVVSSVGNHIELYDKNIQPKAVFQITNIPTVEELKGEYESDWLEVPLGNRNVVSSVGNGVLKDSAEKELAVQVLAASMYDAELSNLMIYGVPKKDYVLKDGVVVEGQFSSNMGSFSQIGNNLIAYPNLLEVKEKRERTETLLQNTPEQLCSTFAPVWEDDIWDKMLDVVGIYSRIRKTVGFEDIPDLNGYVEEQKTLLKEAGAEEIISALQEQVNDWKE